MPTPNKLKGLTKEQFKVLMREHNNKLADVAKLYNATPRSLQIWAKKHGCPGRFVYECE